MWVSGGVLNLAVCCCALSELGTRAGADFCGHSQSARQFEYPLPELPHGQRVETDPRGSGIRSQPDAISAAWHAPVGDLHPVPRQASLHQRRTPMPGLPCRYSPASTGSQLRAMSHRARLAGFGPADPAAQQPLSADGRSCGRRLRFLPQGRGQQPVSGDVDRVLIRVTRRISTRPRNPNHASAKFSTTCNTCHSTDNWLNAKFDHNTVWIPLDRRPRRSAPQCTDCQRQQQLQPEQPHLLLCHQKDFPAATTRLTSGKFPHDL